MKLLYPPSSPFAAAPEAYDDLFGKGCRYENAFDAVGDKVMATEVLYCKSKQCFWYVSIDLQGGGRWSRAVLRNRTHENM